MDTTTIRKMIEDHQHYLKRDVENWKIMKADFSDVDFPMNFDFQNANLSYANFEKARVAYCDMSKCILIGASFKNADMYTVDLHGATLKGADLSGTNLMHADLSRAKLDSANLDYADLNYICARGAFFSGSSIVGSRMNGADMSYTVLDYATIKPRECSDVVWNGAFGLNRAKELPYIPMTCPETGSFVGYKKCRYGAKFYIVVLKIPANAKRVSGTESKCRCSKAKVVAIQNLDGTIAGIPYARSIFDVDFQYVVGETVEPSCFDEDRFDTCSGGIHFFMNRMDAVNY